MTKPAISVTGKPIANRFSVGAARVSTASAMFTTSSAAINGSASITPAEKMVLPQRAIAIQPLAGNRSAPTGHHSKLLPITASNIRWPLIDRKMSIASRPRNSEITGDCAALSGS